MDNVIQLLKDNEKPFILMSEEMQDWMLDVEIIEDIEQMVCRVNLKIDWFSMSIRINKGNCKHMEGTFHLRPDYEEKPNIVECEIKEKNDNELRYNYNGDSDIWILIAKAVNDPNFIGFKFKDGTVMGSPVKYSVPGMTSKGYYASYGDIKTSQALEHHATHILFRQKKQE